MKRMVRITYALQVWAALVGAGTVWVAWLSFTEGRSVATALNIFCGLFNAWLFCVQAALRSRWSKQR
jgi:glycerol-3-phosphate acyltransferase PlsY